MYFLFVLYYIKWTAIGQDKCHNMFNEIPEPMELYNFAWNTNNAE